MGLFGDFGSANERARIQRAMDSIGARAGSHQENCERCRHYVSPPQSGSKYYGGCSYYQIHVFSNHVCGQFDR